MEIVHIEALKMDNGEILCNGVSIGYEKNLKIVKRFDAITGEEIIETK
jgi:hypothetical protein